MWLRIFWQNNAMKILRLLKWPECMNGVQRYLVVGNRQTYTDHGNVRCNWLNGERQPANWMKKNTSDQFQTAPSWCIYRNCVAVLSIEKHRAMAKTELMLIRRGGMRTIAFLSRQVAKWVLRNVGADYYWSTTDNNRTSTAPAQADKTMTRDGAPDCRNSRISTAMSINI